MYVPPVLRGDLSFQKFILLDTITLISLALHTTIILVSMTWAKMMIISKFQLLLRTPCHSAARIAVNRHPTATGSVAYQLDDSAASRHQ